MKTYVINSQNPGVVQLGQQYDNNAVRIEFYGLESGYDYYIIMTAEADKYYSVLLDDKNGWTISNIYTQKAGTFPLQICTRNEAGEYIAHSPIFKGVLASSICRDDPAEEVVPDVVKTIFEQMKELFNGTKSAAENVPQITAEDTEGGVNIIITRGADTITATLFDGKDGQDGEPGKDGQDGQPGEDGQDGLDGVSPILSETQTATGYDITITDGAGTRTISLTNGQDGKDG